MDIREKILDEASRLFAARGYDAVSMRHIAGQAGMTQANLYHHFKDKEDLLLSSLDHVFSGKAHDFAAVIDECPDPGQALARAISWFVTMLFEDTVFSRLFFRELETGDADRLRYLTENVFQEPFSRTVDLIEKALGPPEPVSSTFLLSSLIVGCFQFAKIFRFLRESQGQSMDPEGITRHILEAIRQNAILRFGNETSRSGNDGEGWC